MASADPQNVVAEPKLGFLGLPREVQKDIVSHCTQVDLICLSLVSKHFRELAAAQLYRSFHIVFPDEDDPAFDSPIDGLAGGLETFVTSDYDYGKHLKDLSLDTLSAGDKAEKAYKPYLYSVSCGKFMNTLLLLTLRKAKSLETFRWNIRVELSRPVYKVLHQIDTLSHIHLRLQAGPSLYETPPPLPYNSPHPAASSSAPHMPSAAPPPAPQPIFGVPIPTNAFYIPGMSAPPPPQPKPVARVRASKKTSLSKEPPTLSGFKKLKTLSVLDIDTLDVITELKACIRNSSGTLSKLKFSFSDSLAMQARKPPPDLDPDDSDPEDEFQAVPVPPPGGYNDVSGPAKAYRAMEERKSQESVLGRIFDVEPSVVKKSQKQPREKENESKGEQTPLSEQSLSDPGQDFIGAIKAVSAKLMTELHAITTDVEFTAGQQEILNTIETAARMYVAAEEKKARETKQQQQQQPEITAISGPSSSDAAQEPKNDEGSTSGDISTSPDVQSATSKMKDSKKDEDPNDIDIEAPEEQLIFELDLPTATKDAPAGDAPTPASDPSPSSPTSLTNGISLPTTVEDANGSGSLDLAAQEVNIKVLFEKLEVFKSQANKLVKEIRELPSGASHLDVGRVAEADKKAQSLADDIEDVGKEIEKVEAEVDLAEKQISNLAVADTAQSKDQLIHDYLRTTRGIALQSLSIYLIPVKASVLSRAIDLRALKRITLLNVGPQAPIWAHLQKENKESPLPLRKIFTDNVSSVFLNFVSELEELHELFILERDAKYKPESFAPKTNMTIDHIRRLVLKKHIGTLKRLMIKNSADQSWDLNDKAVMLICKRGKQLRELACNMGIKSVHTFMQRMAGLVNLRALHIIQLRNDDTCVWVMRETKRFLIDNLTHHPEMKLEWISIDDDDRVERLIRTSQLPKKDKDSKKGKGKKTASGININSDTFPALLGTSDNWNNPVSDSDDDDDDDDDTRDPRIETMENIHFYDVWAVRIFKKEVVHGRL
ncbi:hypothetical protein B0H63DRAFT_557497 [Podospora didyma]|uniref:F-box domain-containing protein n=1 Tax=Podospora didyma TaxID=330526 RepID=A0AAE0NZE8_9PEZI|nr:hypothetical protein B0H63DRAFT_557497 [Podospora didyma]